VKVSLIATVKDAAPHVERFLSSVTAQTRRPDEVVIVDGGSTDGTVDILRAAEGVTPIEEPGANIARGRNVAIAAATHDVIAVSDADCVLEPDWLERLIAPIERGADVAMGAYRPSVERFFQACIAAINLPDADELDEATFMPSGRSVAFRREAIEAAGGYPEWLDIGEDMVVDLRWRELQLDLRLARDAVVRWPLRPTLAETWRQYFRYARGDAIAGLHPERHALRFGVYSGALYAWSTKGAGRKLLSIGGVAAYASTPLRRAVRRFPEPAERAKALVAIPPLMAFLDAAKMAGFLAGTRHRSDPRREGPHPSFTNVTRAVTRGLKGP
jgi:glycosyltransferase involved in cell wall biosynthesis